MKQSPARVALVLLFLFIGCFGVAYAAAGMLTALPAPAVGGTCGPSTGSETALEALAEPGSIGAGPEPPASNATAHHQWQTFIQQCQSLADRRGLASLAVFVLSLAVAAIGLIWVLRRPRSEDDTEDHVDGAADWPVEPGPGDPSELVGAGAVIAPPATSAYGMAPYPAQAPSAWPAQPPAPYPYAALPDPYAATPAATQPPAYPPAPPYPQQAAPPAPYPAATPYPSAPAYPPAPPYPSTPAHPQASAPYAPPPPPHPGAQPSPPAATPLPPVDVAPAAPAYPSVAPPVPPALPSDPASTSPDDPTQT